MTLELIVTPFCNLNCSYCYYKGIEYRENMTFETAKRAVDLFCKLSIDKKEEVLYITFFGGEPLLCIELIIKIVKYIKSTCHNELNIRFVIGTNGTLINKEIADFLNEHNFIIHVSLDGNKNSHSLNRRDNSNRTFYSAITDGIGMLNKENTYAATVVRVNSVNEFFSNIKYIYDLSISRIIVSCDFSDKWDNNTFKILKNQYKKCAVLYKSYYKNNSDFFFSLFDDKINLYLTHSSYKQTCCKIGENNFVVAPKGDLFPCTRFANRSIGNDYSTGNIFTGINHNTVKLIKESLENDKKECTTCTIKNMCLGNSCSCISYSTTGSIDGINPFVCEHERFVVGLAKSIIKDMKMKSV